MLEREPRKQKYYNQGQVLRVESRGLMQDLKAVLLGSIRPSEEQQALERILTRAETCMASLGREQAACGSIESADFDLAALIQATAGMALENPEEFFAEDKQPQHDAVGAELGRLRKLNVVEYSDIVGLTERLTVLGIFNR